MDNPSFQRMLLLSNIVTPNRVAIAFFLVLTDISGLP